MNILLIDTSDNKEIMIGLRMGDKEFIKRHAVDKRRAQVVLPLAEELLKEHELEIKDISGIEVNTGPGSFTGLRVGVTVANALGILLGIPVNGKEVGESVEPVYK